LLVLARANRRRSILCKAIITKEELSGLWYRADESKSINRSGNDWARVGGGKTKSLLTEKRKRNWGVEKKGYHPSSEKQKLMMKRERGFSNRDGIARDSQRQASGGFSQERERCAPHWPMLAGAFLYKKQLET